MRTRKPHVDRFLEKIEHDEETGCWLWTRYLDHSGYGRFHAQLGRAVLAHRWAYEEWVGPIPNGLVLDHRCNVRNCVNPWHLELVTTGENTRRGRSFSTVNAAKTACDSGHELAGENVKIRTRVIIERVCVTCERDRKRRYKRRQREAAAA